MKSLRLVVFTCVLLASLAESAFANTTHYVYIVGSEAFRQDSNSNIASIVSSYFGAGVRSTSGSSNTLSSVISAKCNQWIIPNFSSGVDLEINASFTGSSAGFESTASGGGNPSLYGHFIPDGTGTVSNPSFLVSNTENHTPDFTLSDVFQATTPFNGVSTFYGAAGAGSPFTGTFPSLARNYFLGLVPYKFVASPGAAASGLSNITTAQAQALFIYGQLPLAFFTGNHADEGKWVYGLSPDSGSGARLVAQAETGIGGATPLTIYQPTISGGTVDSSGNRINGTVTNPFDSMPLAPAVRIPSTGIWATQGSSGYANVGGQNGLLLAITSTPPTGAIFVTYLGAADSAEALAAGATELSYDGNFFSASAVYEGKYTFWSYEQLYTSTRISGEAASIAKYLMNGGWTQGAASGGVTLSSVYVSRSIDGGPISTIY